MPPKRFDSSPGTKLEIMKKRKYYVLLGFLKEDQETYYDKPGCIVSEVYVDNRHILSNDHLTIYRVSGILDRRMFGQNKAKDQVAHLKIMVERYSKLYPEFEWKFFRGGSKNCPVSVDWSETLEIRKVYSKKWKDKHKYRTGKKEPTMLPFKMKKEN